VTLHIVCRWTAGATRTTLLISTPSSLTLTPAVYKSTKHRHLGIHPTRPPGTMPGRTHPAFCPAAPITVPSAARPFTTSLIRPALPRIAIARRATLSQPTSRMSATKPGKPLVPVLMGSAADLPFCRRIAAALDALGIESTLRIASAHKVPARLLGLLEQFEACGRPIVYVAVAGRSNALSGVLDCAVQSPVISCPPYSDSFGGADLFSSIRMPSGVAPALLLDPAGAALMAAKIFGLSDPAICEAVAKLQEANRDRLIEDDAREVAESGVKL
jgi:5-(carboxyamino)imidazole ribonucleotide mutase